MDGLQVTHDRVRPEGLIAGHCADESGRAGSRSSVMSNELADRGVADRRRAVPLGSAAKCMLKSVTVALRRLLVRARIMVVVRGGGNGPDGCCGGGGPATGLG